MQPKVWVCSVGLALSWLISPVVAVEAVKLPNRQVQKNTTAKPIVVIKKLDGYNPDPISIPIRD